MHNWGFLLMALALPLTPMSAKPMQGCSSVRGAGELAAGSRNIRFLIIGEIHGTEETPAMVGELACEVARIRPVTIALEFPSTATSALNTYLASNGGARARQSFLRSPIWVRSTADGRSSKAMFALIERLRQLRAAGAKIRLAAFQPAEVVNLDQHYYELAMASNWARIADERPDSLNLILVGQIHASKRMVGEYPFAPAASHLRSGDVLSFRSEPIGGHAWNCQDDGCSVHVLSGNAREERYFARFPSEADGFDGSYSVGNRYSASEPAMQK